MVDEKVAIHVCTENRVPTVPHDAQDVSVGGCAERAEAQVDARSAIGRGFDLLLWAAAPKVAGEGVGAAVSRLAPVSEWRLATRIAPTLGAQDWTALVSQFTWPTEWALAVIQCESSGDPLAYNPAGPYVGLFQVLNGSSDPYTNALQAHYQYRQWVEGIRAVSPWPTCGPYRP